MPDLDPDRFQADCARCLGLCCVAPAFSRSADFALTKPAGRPCPHLRADSACSIHTELRPRGFGGCAAYDCFGAGQQVSQVTFGGQDWRQAADRGAAMFAAFRRMRDLHELLWYLAQARTLPGTGPLHARLRALHDEIEAGTQLSPAALASLDLPAHQRAAGDLLAQASLLARGAAGAPAGPDLAGADLAGRDLRRRELRRASLRGACLIGVDLRGADLSGTDLAGADLRGARLGGADLSGSLFLTQAQLDAAAGDAGTRLPPRRVRPSHWRTRR